MTMYHNVSQLNVSQCITMYDNQIYDNVLHPARTARRRCRSHPCSVCISSSLQILTWFPLSLFLKQKQNDTSHYVNMCNFQSLFQSCKRKSTQLKFLSMMIIIWFVYDNHHMIIWAWWSSYDLQAVGTAVHSFRSDQS